MKNATSNLSSKLKAVQIKTEDLIKIKGGNSEIVIEEDIIG